MLKSEINLYALLKKALFAEFYTKKPHALLWRDALKLKHAIDNEDQDQIDCIVQRYDCELDEDVQKTDCNIVTELTTEEIIKESPCEEFEIDIV